ncbi:MAG TPA: class I SAM-dependent methyltransferase [Armatimonadota bacterium]|jgi:ubiquinone/menaquinone biosynthesis C-methylase UbiE
METRKHWEDIYETKPLTEVSWFQDHAEISLQLIERTGVPRTGQIIDVGGGASTLVDDLLNAGYRNITVLDISAPALHAARQRLGPHAADVTWIAADITAVKLPADHFDMWHDRAVFHFLTGEEDRRRYVEAVQRSVKAGGHVIVATFGPDGPIQCSGLPVMRYDPDSLHDEFGERFDLIEHTTEEHHTPFGTVQQFIYCYCRKA